MQKLFVVILAALNLVGLSASPAAALVMNLSGVLSEGLDYSGEFGVPRRSIAGLPFQMTIAETGAEVTVDGWSFSIPRGYPLVTQPPLQIANTLNYTYVHMSVGDLFRGERTTISSTFEISHVFYTDERPDRQIPYDGNHCQIFSCVSFFQVNRVDCTGNRCDVTQSVYGILDIREYSIDGLALQVPEPRTWALLLCGMFMAGVALRRPNTFRTARA